ncbi:MAG: ATP-dependent Clp protease ATP-binding subunit ClpX [Ectothiorhodospiraceae bacterium]|jgi:ATP-dependent Clp protease ATP-binding subunit ClpX
MGRKAYRSTLGGETEQPLHCSFCGREEGEVVTLIAGPSSYICERCVTECAQILDRELDESVRPNLAELPHPQAIHGYLSQYVVGQEHAKKVLSVAVYNHFKRLSYRASPGDPEIRKSNIMLVGPSGSGKTFLAETLARFLDVPFAVADATTLTEAGYVGEDVETIVQRLLQQADNDPVRAARGIVYLDEVDKLASRSRNPTHSRDVSGEGVQQALLRLMEGAVVNVHGGQGRRGGESVEIDTREILFICGGAFQGLAEIVAGRTDGGGVGFAADLPRRRETSRAVLESLEPEDLIGYGLIPEFVGRLPITAVLEHLDEAALVRILTEPRNALVRQYQTLFDSEGCRLEFTDGALHAIAEEALQRGTGARGLRGVLERILLEPMYSLPGLAARSRITIDEDAARAQQWPDRTRRVVQ